MKKIFTLLILIYPLQLFAWDCGIYEHDSSILIVFFVLILILLSFINFLLLKNYYIESFKEKYEELKINKILKYHLSLIILIPLITYVLIILDNIFDLFWVRHLEIKLIIFLLWTFISINLLNKYIYKKINIIPGYWKILFIHLILFLIISSEILISLFNNIFY